MHAKPDFRSTMDGEDQCRLPVQPVYRDLTAQRSLQDLAAGKTVEKKTFMAEPWYVNEDILPEVKYLHNACRQGSF
jgi:hypothetical protein